MYYVALLSFSQFVQNYPFFTFAKKNGVIYVFSLVSTSFFLMIVDTAIFSATFLAFLLVLLLSEKIALRPITNPRLAGRRTFENIIM